MVEPAPLPQVWPHEKNMMPSRTHAPPATVLRSLGSAWLQSGLPVAASYARAIGLAGLPSAVKPATTLPTITGELRQVLWIAPHGCCPIVSPVRASTAMKTEPPSSGLRVVEEPFRVM